MLHSVSARRDAANSAIAEIRGEIRRTTTVVPAILGCALSAALACAAPGAPARAAHPAAKFTTLFTFSNVTDGIVPLQLATVNGALYGITELGAGTNTGALFSFDPVHRKETILANFGVDGWGSYPSNLNAFGNDMYVSTQTGQIFQYSTATSKGSTVASVPDGGTPNAILNVGGDLYGTALVARTTSILFDVHPANGAISTLFNFTGWSEGGFPSGQLAYQSGSLYGTVGVWRNYPGGGFFSYDLATGAEKVIYRFHAKTDGGEAGGGVTLCNGILYTMNDVFGPTGHGTAFSYNPATGAAKTLYAFQGGTDSAAPFSAPICLNNMLYASASGGGANNFGTVFSINPATGKETILHSFTGTDGANPSGSLVAIKNVLYGTTPQVASNGGFLLTGTIFRLTP